MSSGVTKPPGGTGAAGATGAGTGIGAAVLGGAVNGVTGEIDVLGATCVAGITDDGGGDDEVAAVRAVFPADIGAA